MLSKEDLLAQRYYFEHNENLYIIIKGNFIIDFYILFEETNWCYYIFNRVNKKFEECPKRYEDDYELIKNYFLHDMTQYFFNSLDKLIDYFNKYIAKEGNE